MLTARFLSSISSVSISNADTVVRRNSRPKEVHGDCLRLGSSAGEVVDAEHFLHILKLSVKGDV
jgi:hypothetical protein